MHRLSLVPKVLDGQRGATGRDQLFSQRATDVLREGLLSTCHAVDTSKTSRAIVAVGSSSSSAAVVAVAVVLAVAVTTATLVLALQY